MSNGDDRILRMFCGGGSERSLNKALEELEKILWAFLHRRFGISASQQQDAEELMQDTLLKLVFMCKKGKITAKLDAQLIKLAQVILQRAWTKYLKKKPSPSNPNRETHEIEDSADDFEDTLEDLALIEKRLSLARPCQKEIYEKSPRCEEVWRLRLIEKLDWEEIGKRMGYEGKNQAQLAKNLARNCLKRIRKCMQKNNT